jgi:hypothetical protein
VCLHLSAQFIVDRPSSEQVAETPEPLTDDRHVEVHASARIKLIALAVRRYCAISVSSCRRPPAVMRYSRTFRPDSDSRQAAFTHPLMSNF